MMSYNENTYIEDTEQRLLKVEKLLGFKQIEEVCKNAQNSKLSENAGRLLNKIGGEVPPPP